MASVFVIEDDRCARDAAVGALSDSGFVVRAGPCHLESLQAVFDETPDVVVLDLGPADQLGCDLLRMIRAVSQVPVIVVAAYPNGHHVAEALDAGADEYVAKPFSGEELAARVRALLRRVDQPQVPGLLEVGDIEIDLHSREVRLQGIEIECNRKEFDLLAHLAARPGQTVTRKELFAEVWRQPYGGADRTIDVHISWLRRKLGESAAEPRYIHTVRGVGIKFVDPG